MRKLSSPQWAYLIQTIVLAISMVFLSGCRVNEDGAKKTAVALAAKLVQTVTSPEAQQIFEKSQHSLDDLLDKVGEGVSEVSKEAINQILRELDQEINTKLPEIAPIITPIVNDEINRV